MVCAIYEKNVKISLRRVKALGRSIWNFMPRILFCFRFGKHQRFTFSVYLSSISYRQHFIDFSYLQVCNELMTWNIFILLGRGGEWMLFVVIFEFCDFDVVNMAQWRTQWNSKNRKKHKIGDPMTHNGLKYKLMGMFVCCMWNVHQENGMENRQISDKVISERNKHWKPFIRRSIAMRQYHHQHREVDEAIFGFLMSVNIKTTAGGSFGATNIIFRVVHADSL